MVKNVFQDQNLIFDLDVTLIRTFRRGIHPGAVCYVPKNIPSMDAEHH